VGSSIVMTVQGGPELLGLPLFGLLGFLVATFNSIWLVWSIWRAGRE
jgi:ubiquinone biosynthesis protein